MSDKKKDAVAPDEANADEPITTQDYPMPAPPAPDSDAITTQDYPMPPRRRTRTPSPPRTTRCRPRPPWTWAASSTTRPSIPTGIGRGGAEGEPPRPRHVRASGRSGSLGSSRGGSHTPDPEKGQDDLSASRTR